jgi:predicted alpha/beta-hydrolase family hydrolase
VARRAAAGPDGAGLTTPGEIPIDTPRGPARAHVALPETLSPRAALVLGHGAGGGVGAPDLQTAARTALGLGCAVALVEQPYRVAGRRSPAPAPALDEAWTAVVSHLGGHELAGLPVITGGRSSGARVACRTAAATGAIAVLCLAFPLLPPARRSSSREPVSRLPELEAVTVPVLIVQGAGDRFGMPPAGPSRTVITVAGDHGLKTDLRALAEAIAAWLTPLTA